MTTDKDATIARLTAENEALRAQICELEESQANNTDWRDCRWKLWMWLLTKPGVESIELVDGGEDAVLANFQTAIEAMCEAHIGAVLQEAVDACGWDEKSKTAILALNPEAIAAKAKRREPQGTLGHGYMVNTPLFGETNIAYRTVVVDYDEVKVWKDKAQKAEAEVARLREALRSIADNSCCGGCQEAALVARAQIGAVPRKTFPILGGNGARIDYNLVADHGGQAKQNHGQSVDRLAERGGLSWCELYAVLHNRRYQKIDTNEALVACRALEAQYLSALDPDAIAANAKQRDRQEKPHE